MFLKKSQLLELLEHTKHVSALQMQERISLIFLYELVGVPLNIQVFRGFWDTRPLV